MMHEIETGMFNERRGQTSNIIAEFHSIQEKNLMGLIRGMGVNPRQ